MNIGPTAQRNAIVAAAAARRAKAEEAHSRVVAAFERAANAGLDPEIDAIAKECGVSRATAYRALGDRK
jgi:AcrR family transcriptional regulator